MDAQPLVCRSCNGPLREVLDLGVQPPANALLDRSDSPEQHYPLILMACKGCLLLQTSFDVPPEKLFNSSYPYFSGQSRQWVEHCREYAKKVTERFALDGKSFVIEIGGNDGTLLKEFRFCYTVNVEPSASVATASAAYGIDTVETRWEEFESRWPADLIIGNNVLAHTPNINGFVASIERNLAPNGIVTLEFPWVVNLLRECQFDTVYHEHYSYLSLTALIPLFRRHGLTIFDVQRIPTHGGSLCVYAARRPTAADLASVLSEERLLREPKVFTSFRERALSVRDAVRVFVRSSKPLYAYGAAAKGNTLLNWCGITSKDILAVADTTPAKQGKWLPGSHIPVISEERLLEIQPPTVLILPWNWQSEITAKLSPKMPNTTFVSPRGLVDNDLLSSVIAMADALGV